MFINNRFATAMAVLMMALSMSAQTLSRYDQDKAFGWAVCTSLTSADGDVKGGQGGRTVVLQSDGGDMKDRIIDAITHNDVIVLDGQAGPFTVSSVIRFKNLESKTILGINGACLTTQFKLTDTLRRLLDERGVKSLPTSSDGNPHVLSNGRRVTEVREWAVRQTLIDALGDSLERFRESGIFSLDGAHDIIIRNLTFLGPGAVDVSGSDLLSLSWGSTNVWVDHCEFVDGMDGNFDITTRSDFITVSWCRFRYTDATYDHANTNLVGSSDNAEKNGIDNLNITYAFCHWDQGCNQRMPMARFGTVHLLNNLYTCGGSSLAVNARRESEVLLEGCYFAEGVRRPFRSDGAKAYVFRDNIVEGDIQFPLSFGTVAIPYSYIPMPVAEVRTEVARYAGPMLTADSKECCR